MKKNNEEYIPQFDYSNFEEEETKKASEKCLLCGKESISLENGVCFFCRKAIQEKEEKGTVKHPNRERYLEWCEEYAVEKANELKVGLIFLPLFKYGFGSLWFLPAIWCLIFLINIANEATVLEIISIIGITMFFVALGVLFNMNTKRKREKKFSKFNNMTIKLEESGSWVCPCCHRINERISFCKDCGVFPKITN